MLHVPFPVPARVPARPAGLPGETDADVMGIAETIEWLQRECREGKWHLAVNVTIRQAQAWLPRGLLSESGWLARQWPERCPACCSCSQSTPAQPPPPSTPPPSPPASPCSNFTPKPHTPFQWHSVSTAEFLRKQVGL